MDEILREYVFEMYTIIFEDLHPCELGSRRMAKLSLESESNYEQLICVGKEYQLPPLRLL